MAVELFKRLYNQNLEKGEVFSFQVLLDQLNFLTPDKKDKQSVPYSSSDIDLIKNCQDSFIRNFCMNSAIKKSPNFDSTFLKRFADFFYTSEYSEQKLAQCLFLIHAAKTDCHLLTDYEAEQLFISYFLNFSTIAIKTDFDLTFNQFFSIFQFLIQSKNFIKIINETIEEIVVSGSSSKTFNFNNLKLVFFESEFSDVYGFSGKDRIYLNAKSILNTFKLPISEEKKWPIAKLNFIKLILHEASHVALRFKLNDLNLSSPFLNEQIKKGKVKKNVGECGFETEKRYFKANIDWNMSAIKNINFDYCKQFLNNFLNDVKVEFDLEKANVKIESEEMFHSSGFGIHFKRGPTFRF